MIPISALLLLDSSKYCIVYPSLEQRHQFLKSILRHLIPLAAELTLHSVVDCYVLILTRFLLLGLLKFVVPVYQVLRICLHSRPLR